RAYEADSISIFGGIIACNREVDKATAEQMAEIFLEIVMAPSFSKEAIEVLTQKKNIRLLALSGMEESDSVEKVTTVKGGVLLQTSDDGQVTEADLQVVTDRKPTEEEIKDLL